VADTEHAAWGIGERQARVAAVCKHETEGSGSICWQYTRHAGSARSSGQCLFVRFGWNAQSSSSGRSAFEYHRRVPSSPHTRARDRHRADCSSSPMAQGADLAAHGGHLAGRPSRLACLRFGRCRKDTKAQANSIATLGRRCRRHRLIAVVLAREGCGFGGRSPTEPHQSDPSVQEGGDSAKSRLSHVGPRQTERRAECSDSVRGDRATLLGQRVCSVSGCGQP